jgi:hypothetical protein
MEQTAVNVLTAILIAAISAWITVQLSLRRFRTEKWWERKVDAYSRVIEALHNSKAFSDQYLHATYQGRELSEERQAELRLRARAARDDILKAMDVGAFLFSKEALDRLKQYQKDEEDASKHESWHDHLESDWAAANNCLKDIIAISKKDLRTT